MSSIPVRIALHGLIALVPTLDPSSGANRMTALLVDGRTANAAECMAEHHPKLEVVVADTSQCLAVTGCRSFGSHCICEFNPNTATDPLVGKEISLSISPTPAMASEKPGSDLPTHSVPADDGEASSFSYVANLSQTPFGLAINPDYLASDPPQSARMNVVTRVQVPYQDIAACALATRPDGGGANVHAMSFRALHDSSKPGEMSYALAQLVVAKLNVPDAGTGTQVVTLHISDLGGANDVPITLLPGGADGYKIEISNEPGGPLEFDNPCDDGVARHFNHFYDLALPTTPPRPRLLPHVRFTQFENAELLAPAICKDPTFQLMNRPICPMASFNP